MTFPFPVPDDLQALIRQETWAEVSVGRSGAWVFAADQKFLKVQRVQTADSLQLEQQKLLWLGQHLPVPAVLHFSQQEGHEFLLTSRIAGQDLSVLAIKDREQAVRWFALSLKRWHSLPVQDCPFDRSVKTRLPEARLRLAAGLVDQTGFAEVSPEDMLEQLEQSIPPEDLVLTHGDYCFPNVLYQDGQLSGFVDVGRAGLSDRHTDLTLALWSTQYNCGPGWEEVFWQEYGLEQLDPQKLAYFSALDGFF
ncbi:APH(3') family aminoglycoside O-phosphotransferase [Deinococcus roseus]|nr:APH(3') family aminoglycoside O-phosphotransferase [Deinococcus roseus]